MRYETLETERDGAVLRVWLNRPERRNAVNATMLREVGDLFRALETDFDSRVVVLGGRGKSFCAGADRKPPESGTGPEREPGDRERRWLGQLGRRAARAIEECEAVTVARIQGHAIGGGCCFALSCDFRVAARDAIFRVPEVDLGVPLSWAGTPRLIHEIGAARAREVLLLCRDIDAETAERWGMVHRAVAPEALDAEVSRWVEELLDKPELPVHMTKTQLRGFARVAALGDSSEADGDMIALARQSPVMQARFAMPPRKS
jgi:enoyl-CoA hydratase/carnithine racemase